MFKENQDSSLIVHESRLLFLSPVLPGLFVLALGLVSQGGQIRRLLSGLKTRISNLLKRSCIL
jgi:hypothetical protein